MSKRKYKKNKPSKSGEQKTPEKIVIYNLYAGGKGRRRTTVLNQYICLECNKVNLVDEIASKETELYDCRDIECRCCGKITTQICVKDKTLAKSRFEIVPPKTEKEKLAHQAIYVKKREINRGTNK